MCDVTVISGLSARRRRLSFTDGSVVPETGKEHKHVNIVNRTTKCTKRITPVTVRERFCAACLSAVLVTEREKEKRITVEKPFAVIKMKDLYFDKRIIMNYKIQSVGGW